MRQKNYDINNTTCEKLFKYKHLSESERVKIHQLYNENLSYNQIAKRISRSRSTIMREIKRNGILNQPSINAIRNNQKNYKYSYKKAQKIRNLRFARPKTLKRFTTFINYANTNINPQTSLEDLYFNFIKNNTDLPCPCLKSIYNWAHKGIIKFQWGQKIVSSSKQKSNKEPVEDRKFISLRKEDFNFDITDPTPKGHYEIDTIYDKDKKGGALTFNEKYTLKLYSVQLPNRKAITINKALRTIIKEIGPENILSITSDNGVEFAYSKVIEKSYDLKWYYCQPYSSWQRGQNERLNRDIRKYIKKGQSIKRYPKEAYSAIIAKINNKPRRKFGGLSANEYAKLY